MFSLKYDNKDIRVVFHHLNNNGKVKVYETKARNGRFESRLTNGMTTCELFDRGTDGSLTPIVAGLAECSPGDNFCKNTGRKVALKRALTKMSAPREFRKVVWEAYHAKRGVKT